MAGGMAAVPLMAYGFGGMGYGGMMRGERLGEGEGEQTGGYGYEGGGCGDMCAAAASVRMATFRPASQLHVGPIAHSLEDVGGGHR